MTNRRALWVNERVNEHDQHSLLAALNEAVDILHRNRRPDPDFITAFDTLKQSRAMIEKLLHPQASQGPARELVAA